MKKIYSLILMALLFSNIWAQQNLQHNYTLLFLAGTKQLTENVSDFKSTDDLKSYDLFNSRYYLLLQFKAVPTQQEKQAMEGAGIHLLTYIPHYAFISSVPQNFNPNAFQNFNVRSIAKLELKNKMNPLLIEKTVPDFAVKEKGTIDLVVQYYKDITKADALYALTSNGCRLLQPDENLPMATIRVSQNKVQEIAALPFIEYVDPVSGTPEPDDTRGRSLHRSNIINSEMNSGLHYDGAGVHLGLADDGSVSHIDFEGRLHDLTEAGQAGTHGDGTSGIAVGAGNLDPTMTGMATGAELYLFDVFGSSLGDYPQIVNAVANYATDSIVITSTSYSQPGFCNTYGAYGNFADQTIHDNSQLQFVFSAGNNNGADCGYGAGPQWANITGGYKASKNAIACANLTPNGILDASSSRGPASDGRLKPDISANGTDQNSCSEANTYQVFGGTSAACPGIAGINAQLYQAYKTLNGGQEPRSGFIKSCILNSAFDIENAGPDYRTGWGRVNANRAYKIMEENRYAIDTIVQGQQKTISITVPAGQTQIKIMAYWNDYGGSPISGKALVNDLNLTVTDPNGTNYLPLILDPTPNATTLNYLAVPGVDTLNNVEQIVIITPVAGTYNINIDGFEVPQGPQEFFVNWEFLDDAPVLTYPYGSEGFVPGESELIRFDATGNTSTFSLDYSTDLGNSWINITNSIAADIRQYVWAVPNITNDQVLMRVTRNGMSHTSNLFSIIGVPTGIQVLFECPDSIGLQWNAVANAAAYEVFMLGQKYMESKGITTNTSIVITGTNPTVDHWFSVRAIGANGNAGRRAIAINKLAGTLNCSLSIDGGLTSAIVPAPGSYNECNFPNPVLAQIQIQNTAFTSITQADISYSINNGPVVTETFTGNIPMGNFYNFHFTGSPIPLPAGTYNFVAWITYAGDQNHFNDTLVWQVIVMATANAPLIDDFQAGLVNWKVSNPDTNLTWEQRQILVGSDGNPTTAAYVNNYDYNLEGERDYLASKSVDLTGTSQAYMTFDIAYAPYSAAWTDSLLIEISTDCGVNFYSTGYYSGGLNLSTAGGYNTSASWAPASATEWRNDYINLDAWAGNNVIVRFINITGYGNSMLIDNVNILSGTVGINDNSTDNSIVVYPNPSKGIFNVMMNKSLDEQTTVAVNDLDGRLLQSQSWNFNLKNNLQLDLSQFAKGIYFVTLTSNHIRSKQKLIIY